MESLSYADITPLDPEWLWPGKIPYNAVTLVAGDGGIGKGFITADLVARVTLGLAMPDGTVGDRPGPGSAILVTSEDDPNMSTAWRLAAAGARIDQVFDMTEDFSVPESLPTLRERIDEIDETEDKDGSKVNSPMRLVVIDPLSDVSSISLTSSNVRVRKMVMRPLERLAKSKGIALVVIHHTVKSGRIAGTRGITDAARQVLRVSHSAQDDRIRLIHVDKSNIASDSVADAAYTITGAFPDTRVSYVSAPADATAPSRAPTVADLVIKVLKEAALETPPKLELGGREIARLADANYGAVRVALTRLKQDGKVWSPEKSMWALEPEIPPVEVA